MRPAASRPVHVTAIGPASATAVATEEGGQIRVTVVVEATFDASIDAGAGARAPAHPRARAAARAYGPAGDVEIALDPVVDPTRIDPEAPPGALAWRGSFLVPGGRALDALRIHAGVELEGAPIGWPAAVESAAPEAPEAPPPNSAPLPRGSDNGETVLVTGPEPTGRDAGDR